MINKNKNLKLIISKLKNVNNNCEYNSFDYSCEENSKNNYTIKIKLEELKMDNFSDIIKSKTTQIEILKLISKNIQKIEENIDFDIKRDLHINFNGNKDSISIEIHYGVLDVKIEDVIVITESEEELSEFTIDHSMLKLFFKNSWVWLKVKFF